MLIVELIEDKVSTKRWKKKRVSVLIATEQPVVRRVRCGRHLSHGRRAALRRGIGYKDRDLSLRCLLIPSFRTLKAQNVAIFQARCSILPCRQDFSIPTTPLQWWQLACCLSERLTAGCTVWSSHTLLPQYHHSRKPTLFVSMALRKQVGQGNSRVPSNQSAVSTQYWTGIPPPQSYLPLKLSLPNCCPPSPHTNSLSLSLTSLTHSGILGENNTLRRKPKPSIRYAGNR